MPRKPPTVIDRIRTGIDCNASSDERAWMDAHAALSELYDELRRFADTFPGDSHQWQGVQNFVKKLGA